MSLRIESDHFFAKFDFVFNLKAQSMTFKGNEMYVFSYIETLKMSNCCVFIH